MVGAPYAKAEQPGAIDRPAALAFLAEARNCETHEKLDRVFAAAIGEAGFESYKHLVLGTGAGTPPKAHSIEESDRPGYHRLVVTVENWAGDWTLVELSGHAGAIDPSARARSALLATLFAGRREQISG